MRFIVSLASKISAKGLLLGSILKLLGEEIGEDMSAGQGTQKQRMDLTTEMMIKGATLLSEACPKCGGVQIRFQGRIYCTIEDDLEKALTQERREVAKEPKKDISQEISLQKIDRSKEREGLRQMLEQKLAEASKELETSKDVEEQTKLLNLISKYVETLEKLGKSA